MRSIDDAAKELVQQLLRRGLEARLSVRAGMRSRDEAYGLARVVAELTGMSWNDASEALDGHQIVLHSIAPERAGAAALQIERAGGLVRIELGLIERYAFVPEHPLRGLQICERLSILDGDLILTRGLLARPPEPRTLLHDAHVSELLAGFDRERARWAASGMVEAANELELLQRVSAREPQLEAELCAAHERFFACAAVYGDWLQAQGDPRGLVAPPSLLIRTTDNEELHEQATRAVEQIVSEHASHLLGSLYLELQPDALVWLGPVLIGATLAPAPKLDPSKGPLIISMMIPGGMPLATFFGRAEYHHADELRTLEKLLALPAAVTLRWLDLEGSFTKHPQLLAKLAAAPCASSLRALELDEPEDLRISGGPFERLQRVTLIESTGELVFDIRLPALRWLSVDFSGAPPGLLACFAGLDAPALEHFELTLEILSDWLAEHGPLLQQLENVLALPSFAALRSLTLGSCGHAPYDGIDQLLAHIPAAATLERVDLREADFDEGTRARLEAGAVTVQELLL